MATVFWDARGIIHIDYLPSKQTRLLRSLLDRFNNILKKKHPYLVKKKVLFHQDNARVYTCPAPMTKFRYELLPPAYSPDLVPCDYSLFPNLKKWFGRKRFTTREQLIAETETYFEGLDKLYCIIRTVWKSWRIVGSSVSSWKETMLKNKNESIKKNVFYYVFLKTYWFALVLYNEILIAKKIQVNVTCNCYCNYKERGDIMYYVYAKILFFYNQNKLIYKITEQVCWIDFHDFIGSLNCYLAFIGCGIAHLHIVQLFRLFASAVS